MATTTNNYIYALVPTDERLYVRNLDTDTWETSLEIDLSAESGSPEESVFYRDGHLYVAYDGEFRAWTVGGIRVSANDLAVDSTSGTIQAGFTHDTHYWAEVSGVMRAFVFATQARDTSRDIDPGGDRGAFHDDTHVWFTRIFNATVDAWVIATGVADTGEDFNLNSAQTTAQGGASDNTYAYISRSNRPEVLRLPAVRQVIPVGA